METSLKQKYLLAIGQIAVNWVAVEEEIKLSILHLLGTHPGVADRITAGEPFENLLRLFAALFRYRVEAPNQIQKFERLVKALQRKNRLRNQYVHSVWVFSVFQDVPPFTRKTSKRNLEQFEYDIKFPKLKELEITATQIEELRIRVARLVGDNAIEIAHHKAWVDSYENESVCNEAVLKIMQSKEQHEDTQSEQEKQA